MGGRCTRGADNLAEYRLVDRTALERASPFHFTWRFFRTSLQPSAVCCSLPVGCVRHDGNQATPPVPRNLGARLPLAFWPPAAILRSEPMGRLDRLREPTGRMRIDHGSGM